MFVVFVAHLARPAHAEAAAIAALVGVTEYEARLALAAPAPAILLVTGDRERAAAAAASVRARGHGVHVFDDEHFVPSAQMGRMDDFRLDPDGVRRQADGAYLPYGDVFAILRAVHDTVRTTERPNPGPPPATSSTAWCPPRTRSG